MVPERQDRSRGATLLPSELFLDHQFGGEVHFQIVHLEDVLALLIPTPMSWRPLYKVNQSNKEIISSEYSLP